MNDFWPTIYMSPFCILHMHLCIYFRVLNPCIYLSPLIHMSPAFIWIKTIFKILHTRAKNSNKLHQVVSTCMTYTIIGPYNIISSPPDICYSSLSGMNDTLLVAHWPSSLFYHEQLTIQWWLAWYNFQYSRPYLLAPTHIYSVGCAREVWMYSNCLYLKQHTMIS